MARSRQIPGERRRGGWWLPLLLAAVLGSANPVRASTIFEYPVITSPILEASFVGDFAAFTAHRSVGGIEVNFLRLVDVAAGDPAADLSTAMFGTTDALSDAALVDQGSHGTGPVTVPIPASFFPVLAKGRVGLAATFTDTMDGLFALDYLALAIRSTSGVTLALLDTNNGFGIGLPDGGALPLPLPISIAVDATGTGFDESVSSKSFEPKVAPEPGVSLLTIAGLAAAIGQRLRRRSRR